MTDYVDARANELFDFLKSADRRVALPTSPMPDQDDLRTGGRVERTGRDSHRPRTQWRASYRRNVVALDVVAALFAAVLASLVRFGDRLTPMYLGLTVLVPVTWVLALSLAHAYEGRFLGVGTEEYRSVARAAVTLVALIAFLSYAGQLDIARGYVVVAFPALLGSDLALRHLQRQMLVRQRSRGDNMQRTVVVGRADSVASLVREIKRAPGTGLEVVAACVSGLEGVWPKVSEIEGVPVLGCPEEALGAVDLVDAEVVAVASHPDLVGHSLRRLAWSLEERQVELVVAPGILEVAGPRLTIRPAAGMSLLHVERPATSGARRVVKSVVDKAMAVFITAAALPALLVIGLLVRLDSPGPVLFRQRRIGARGESFNMLKFRTMVVDAEARLVQVCGGHETNAVLFKVRDDPRVTPVGRFLRRYSLDELPQLFNVLRGEMSLVGPRPPLPREVEAYEPDAVRRLRVKPGLTGLWQVSGRSDLSWEESLRLDLWYVDNWSLMLDLQIIVRTANAILRGAGAY